MSDINATEIQDQIDQCQACFERLQAQGETAPEVAAFVQHQQQLLQVLFSWLLE